MSTTNSELARSKQLGMNHGAAVGRLKKNLLFRLAQELGLTTCFRCGQEIVDAKTLSLDHKKSWFHVSADLFWDLDNVVFSHQICNSKGREYYRRSLPEGKSWCGRCKQMLPIEAFNKGKRWNGLNYYCRQCDSKRRKCKV